eukprot:UN33926
MGIQDQFLKRLLLCLSSWKSGEQIFDLLNSLSKLNENFKKSLVQNGAIESLAQCLIRVSDTIVVSDKVFPTRLHQSDMTQSITILTSLIRICKTNTNSSVQSPLYKGEVPGSLNLSKTELELFNSEDFYSYLFAKIVN